MGFFTDIGSGFKAKAYYKEKKGTINAYNVYDVFVDVMTKVSNLEFSDGSRANVNKDLKKEFAKHAHRLIKNKSVLNNTVDKIMGY